MGCSKITCRNFNFLEVVHRKNASDFKKNRRNGDHLGNIRLSYTDVNQNNAYPIFLEIIEEINYYPFGLKHKGYNNVTTSNGNSVAQRWKFGGKEYQDELNLNWYDITARNYDPALGRWMNLDPLAEQMRRHSPYNYAFDNPIYFIDPDGMAPEDWIKNLKTGKIKWYDATGDRAIFMAAKEDGDLDKKSIFTPSESVKAKYKNLGRSFFGAKGDNPSDNTQIANQQDEYLTEVSSKLNRIARVDYTSDALGKGMHGDITKEVLKSGFMGSGSKSGNSKNNSKFGEVVSFAKDFVQGEVKGKITEKVAEKALGIGEKIVGVITMAMTTTTMGDSSRSSRTKHNAIRAFQTKVAPLITPKTILKISEHKY